MIPSRLWFLLVFLLLLLLLFDFQYVEAQAQPPGVVSSQDVSNFQPGVGILMGALSIGFVLACVLLIYTRFCLDERSSSVAPGTNFPGLESWSSGIEKSVIESLPLFRFSSLKGSKEGLECSVCLSRFEDVEILRLLPQCKHAFHVGCIDRWLEGHATCPLCRQRLDPEDPRIFTYSNSMRFLLRNDSRSIARGDVDIETNLQPYIQREANVPRFGFGSSLRKLFRDGKDADECNSVGSGHKDHHTQRPSHLHRFNHRIIVPQVIFNNRWSDLCSSDLVFLNSEMMNSESGDTLSNPLSGARHPVKSGQSTGEDHAITIRDEMELKRSLERKIVLSSGNSPTSGSDPGKLVVQDEKRTMSEITAMSRFSANEDRDDVNKQDRTRRLWLPIARRTVQWFANRERRPEEPPRRQFLRG
ncbi:hypothetical protein MLD38_006870 [Melastoma candidum]|uniref:Uncharacterized protein n=1 Tax=Melastoma candidum TaxID=119954 RepID=A0ACB9RPF2_9MYRT|nr:hypothetical protein MLD38_006870 [Melastoma candidum]